MTLTLHHFINPPRLVVGSFAFIILLGASVLNLPGMQAEPVSYLDCLFTSTSAVCVTGLITVDTAKVWTSLGQAVIVVLIQLGGLGIMTLSVEIGRAHV
jgi:trk system potassium uptake protein TrkH